MRAKEADEGDELAPDPLPLAPAVLVMAMARRG